MRLSLIACALLLLSGPLLAQEPTPKAQPAQGTEEQLRLLRRQIADLQAQLALQRKQLQEQAQRIQRLEKAISERPSGTTDDEAERYKAAVRITVARKLEDYPKAVELLQGIPKTSELHADAQAILAWIKADLQVRKAQQLYDEGDAKQALTLLEQVLQLEVLGPNARDGVRLRRQRIAQVVRAYERGIELQKTGDAAAARQAFAEVLAIEANGMNHFRRKARVELAGLLAAISGQILDNAEAVAKAGDEAKKTNALLTVTILLEGLPKTHPHRARAEAVLQALSPPD